MCSGSCNTLDGLSNKACVPNETEDLSLYIFSVTTGINEWRILAKHISFKCDCKFDGKKCTSNHNCWCKCKKGCLWNPATCIGDSVVICGKIVEETKTVPTKTVQRKCTFRNFYILLFFLLIAIELLITASIYLIKHWSKYWSKDIDINNVL